MSEISALPSAPRDFWEWLKQSRKYFGLLSFSSLLSIASLILTYTKQSSGSSSQSSGSSPVPSDLSLLAKPLFWMLSLQVFAIVVLQVLMPAPRRGLNVSKQASTAMRQFFIAWRALWGFWLLLYLWLAGKESVARIILPAHKESLERFYREHLHWLLSGNIDNLLNNLPTVALFMCYLVLARETVDEEDHSFFSLLWVPALATAITLTALEVLITHLVGQQDGADVVKVFRWISGGAAGVVTALLIGRLDSRVINLPTWAVGLLYLYAVIQAGWASFPDSTPTAMYVLSLALGLKTLWFIVVAWLLKSGMLSFYLDRLRTLDITLRQDRDVFFAGSHSTPQDVVTPAADAGTPGDAGVSMRSDDKGASADTHSPHGDGEQEASHAKPPLTPAGSRKNSVLSVGIVLCSLLLIHAAIVNSSLNAFLWRLGLVLVLPASSLVLTWYSRRPAPFIAAQALLWAAIGAVAGLFVASISQATQVAHNIIAPAAAVVMACSAVAWTALRQRGALPQLDRRSVVTLTASVFSMLGVIGDKEDIRIITRGDNESRDIGQAPRDTS